MLRTGREGAANDRPPEAEAWPDPPLTPPVQLKKGAEQMLTGEQVLSLIDAGFSADEIRQYNQPEAPADPEPAPEPEAPADPETPEDPDTVVDTNVPSYVSREEFAELKSAMENLTKSIHANNVLLASKEAAPKSVSKEEAAKEAIKHFAGIK